MADTELVKLLRDASEMLGVIRWDEDTGEADNRRLLAARDELRERLNAKADEMGA